LDRRSFVAGLPCAALAVSGGGAISAPRLSASATRVDTSQIRLNWTGNARSAQVLMSTDAAANPILMTQVQAQALGNSVVVRAPVSPRPYFLIRPRSGGQVRVAERLLPLEGGRNFRDMGGYQGERGKTVRWGRIFRSGVLAKLTPGDSAYLRSLGIVVICDLRSAQERAAEPSALIGSANFRTRATDYELGSSLGKMMTATTRSEATAAFGDAYIEFLTMLRPQYTEMFESLVENAAPLTVNCTAGKDRTGIASALILSVLGVDRETVIADYALSQVYVPPAYYLNQSVRTVAAQASPYARLPRPVLDVLMGSDPLVMRHALGRIDREFGGPINLAKSQFGLTDRSVRRLRDNFLV
jgi:protein-tyrosine phosphatase